VYVGVFLAVSFSLSLSLFSLSRSLFSLSLALYYCRQRQIFFERERKERESETEREKRESETEREKRESERERKEYCLLRLTISNMTILPAKQAACDLCGFHGSAMQRLRWRTVAL